MRVFTIYLLYLTISIHCSHYIVRKMLPINSSLSPSSVGTDDLSTDRSDALEVLRTQSPTQSEPEPEPSPVVYETVRRDFSLVYIHEILSSALAGIPVVDRAGSIPPNNRFCS